MKMKKSFGAISLALLGILALASCNNSSKASDPTDGKTQAPASEISKPTESKPTGTVEPSSPLEKEIRTSYFSSISLDTTKVKTLFYLGDEFNSDGIQVKNNFVRVYTDNSRDSESRDAVNVSIDSSEVDLNNTGTYPVTVSSRYGTTIRKQIYNVVVKSNPYDDIKGFSYFAGLSVKYQGDNDFEKTYKVQDLFSKNDLSLVSKVRIVNIDEEGNKTESDSPFLKSYLTIDISAIPVDSNGKLTTRGTFPIKYSYVQTLEIDGKEVDNLIECFTYIHVINPVTSIEKVSTNDTTLEATIKSFDFSNWKFKITREIGSPEEISYSDDLFTVDGLNQYVPGDQTAKITLKENALITINVPVKITNSSLYNIVLDLDLSYNMAVSNKERTQIDEAGYCFGSGINRDEKSRIFDGTAFSIRTKVDTYNNGGSFEIEMPMSGKLLIFIASTGDDIRPVSITHNDELYGEILTGGKDQASKCEIEISEAGTYKFTCAKTFYVYGVIIATER